MEIPDALASAAAGMHAQNERLAEIAQDLANASTVGYKARSAGRRGFSDDLGSAVSRGQTQGVLRQTGVATDLALLGPGYFTVSTPSGIRYTRDGRLSADAQGRLCDARGNAVLGSRGPLTLPHGADIRSDGRVWAGGRVVDRLRIAAFSQPLSQQGPYAAATPQALPVRADAAVRSGCLEESDVDPVAEMTALITTQRAFEANQKTAQRADETLRRAVTDVAAVRS